MPRNGSPEGLENDALWYKDAVIYQVHVRAFYDSNDDGIGDFRGLYEKLDYLQDLGITALWVQPFYVSPLKDDGYDISDYRAINPDYGTLADFRRFLKDAHRRGIRVITELVLNHTSDQHAWFQRARRAPAGSKERDYYVWSDAPERYKEARVIFKDFEHSNWSWDPVAGAYYWHRFYSHQPDLNYENPRVQREILGVVDYWLRMGVDGFRLDAVPYLYEQEGTSCENLPETHTFLRKLREHVDRNFPNRVLLAEANQWPDDAAAYFGCGDECNMAYHFPLMPRLFMATRMEDRFPITEIIDQTPEIPANCQWAIFLRNHDELTLEMVTDEERDYMNRVYATDERARINLGIRRRLAPLLGNNRRLIELMNALLFSMPGTPVMYYGDEIGVGDNIYLGDRNGVRTPMQWSADRNAGFSRANPQKLYLPVIIDPEYHYESVNVAAQQSNPHLLLWWMKRLIGLRTRHRAFGRGTMAFVENDNRKVLAYTRHYEDEDVLVVANLSRFVQGAWLKLAQFSGATPVELFGRTRFPLVGDGLYFLSLGPHAFLWFVLERQPPRLSPPALSLDGPPVLATPGRWETVFEGRARDGLCTILSNYIRERRWFGAKARPIRALTIRDVVPVRQRRARTAGFFYTVLQVEFFQGEPEQYVLPLAARPMDWLSAHGDTGWAVIARLTLGKGRGEALLVDATAIPEFAEALLEGFRTRAVLQGNRKSLSFTTARAFRQMDSPDTSETAPALLRAEQSNTSVVYGQRFVLKLFRRLEDGVNPQLELQTYLTELGTVAHVPKIAGAMNYNGETDKSATAAVLEEFVTNECDAWTLTLDELDRFLELVLAERPAPPPRPTGSWPELAAAEPPPELVERADAYFQLARTLGRRTGELHVALAAGVDRPGFKPEPYTPFYQRSLAQALRGRVRSSLSLLSQQYENLPNEARLWAEELVARTDDLLDRVQSVATRRLTGKRIRCHGDLHLGQVLFTGKDFVIIDFEGEPARPLGERRVKRSALRDVAGMLRSFHYATRSAVARRRQDVALGEDADLIEAWAHLWYLGAGASFLGAYLEAAREGSFLPTDDEEIAYLLDLFLLDKGMYELGYELESRPEWVQVPLEGIREVLAHGERAAQVPD